MRKIRTDVTVCIEICFRQADVCSGITNAPGITNELSELPFYDITTHELVTELLFPCLAVKAEIHIISYICSKRQHTAIEKQVSRTDRHKVHLHLP